MIFETNLDFFAILYQMSQDVESERMNCEQILE